MEINRISKVQKPLCEECYHFFSGPEHNEHYVGCVWKYEDETGWHVTCTVMKNQKYGPIAGPIAVDEGTSCFPTREQAEKALKEHIADV